MERLTKKTVGCFEYALKEHEPVPGEFGTYEAFFDYSMAVRKLGRYEDAEEAKALKHMTNGDRIRAMSDEELAVWLNSFGTICVICSENTFVCDDETIACGRCAVGITNWLKQPAEVEHDT